MAPKKSKAASPKQVKTLKHDDATRKNIPTAEYQSVMAADERSPIQVAYERRNRDLDPQLVWRGKDEQDWSDLVVSAPPLYIQEKVHPKVLIDDLMQRTESRQDAQLDLFADFNGIPDEAQGTEFYQHDAHWTNRMILGDSLQVMASLAEREGLRGKVQCIYLDPPYGIKFNSNFQWSTTSRDVKDGKTDHITREPEQVKAFRDTWRDGIHSYLTYLRDRLMVARDLLSDSGSIFVQIGDDNVHSVRCILNEVFGEQNFVSQISFNTKIPLGSKFLMGVNDYILWFSKSIDCLKYRQIYLEKETEDSNEFSLLQFSDGTHRRISKEEKLVNNREARVFQRMDLMATGYASSSDYPIHFHGEIFNPTRRSWKTNESGMNRVLLANRVLKLGKGIRFKSFLDDYPVSQLTNVWTETAGGFSEQKIYVVQTATKVVQRCLLMATDPGDLVLDPMCGSGTSAYVAEQWGRRWITIDTSRVALALARARIMGARYPYYLLKDSPAGQEKEAELKGGKLLVASGLSGDQSQPTNHQPPTHNSIRQGFVYDRVPHITLKAIANNAEIDVIWEQYQPQVEQALADLNAALLGHSKPYPVTTGGREGKKIDFTASGTVKLPSGEDAPANALLEWEVPREIPSHWPPATHTPHSAFLQARIARQKEIDASIAASADQEFLYDKPYEDKSIVRVAGPFTVESLSPHRVLAVDQDDELIDPNVTNPDRSSEEADFASVILETLKVAGVQQTDKSDKISFTTLTGWPGDYICAEGRYIEGDSDTEKRAGIFIGPEFGTVSRLDLVDAAKEAGDAGFDVVIACAFNYDAHSSEFKNLGRIQILKARMNADLHMADTLKNTGAGNLFVIFGEPDIDIDEVEDDKIQVTIHGVDVFHPQSGEVRASDTDAIACWFIDTDYNEESFFVRHAYFLGANDPYKSLKTTLKAEIDHEAWESLYSETSRPFDKPKSGRIAVKVINHLGDEVMKVFKPRLGRDPEFFDNRVELSRDPKALRKSNRVVVESVLK
ncbi:site-specific DNA-methyltransferase [Romeria aff. gracilis LEGE 07310]|uniref:Site-specific DNA-methyltransferase n=1 Tax=Vasconcelosia minhoensis LEGE 07310 TaxID=915328 RepID=A0A8J7DDQ7_9CYAN|nr:site-specific DNA-methyltransferase [Romeria gracilis]MBE9079043.1 site-specific DNA-methyltransferase [Romeria aff. gracilis LEGE 07310]